MTFPMSETLANITYASLTLSVVCCLTVIAGYSYLRLALPAIADRVSLRLMLTTAIAELVFCISKFSRTSHDCDISFYTEAVSGVAILYFSFIVTFNLFLVVSLKMDGIKEWGYYITGIFLSLVIPILMYMTQQCDPFYSNDTAVRSLLYVLCVLAIQTCFTLGLWLSLSRLVKQSGRKKMVLKLKRTARHMTFYSACSCLWPVFYTVSFLVKHPGPSEVSFCLLGVFHCWIFWMDPASVILMAHIRELLWQQDPKPKKQVSAPIQTLAPPETVKEEHTRQMEVPVIQVTEETDAGEWEDIPNTKEADRTLDQLKMGPSRLQNIPEAQTSIPPTPQEEKKPLSFLQHDPTAPEEPVFLGHDPSNPGFALKMQEKRPSLSYKGIHRKTPSGQQELLKQAIASNQSLRSASVKTNQIQRGSTVKTGSHTSLVHRKETNVSHSSNTNLQRDTHARDLSKASSTNLQRDTHPKDVSKDSAVRANRLPSRRETAKSSNTSLNQRNKGSQTNLNRQKRKSSDKGSMGGLSPGRMHLPETEERPRSHVEPKRQSSTKKHTKMPSNPQSVESNVKSEYVEAPKESRLKQQFKGNQLLKISREHIQTRQGPPSSSTPSTGGIQTPLSGHSALSTPSPVQMMMHSQTKKKKSTLSMLSVNRESSQKRVSQAQRVDHMTAQLRHYGDNQDAIPVSMTESQQQESGDMPSTFILPNNW